MPTLQYELPKKLLEKRPTIRTDLESMGSVVLEQLPKRARQAVVRHLAIGHLKCEALPDYGMSLISNKPQQPLLVAIGFSKQYPTLAELLAKSEGLQGIKIVTTDL
jgi:hypothetical protein